jgi:peptidase M28-like protein
MGHNLDGSTPSRRTFLTASVAAGGASLIIPGVASADPHGDGHDDGDRPPLAQKPSKELERILHEVDQRRIEATVRKLVSFGTRHTLSTQDDPARGIGAARDWILAEMSKYAADSGGRMTVELQSYIQEPDGDRIPVPTKISNIVATLRGSVTPERVYVITGHYDSRVTDILNATDDAPGADDDASGVAVVMEAARVLSKRDSAATIIFAPVAGEEQNLYGSNHLATVLKAAGTDVQGMFTNDIVGSGTADDGTRDPHTIRLFTEGVPTAETPAEGNTRRAVGGENDSPARQLGRFVRDVADNDATGMNVRIIYRRDRYLRGGDHISFLTQGYPGARFTEPHENYAHQHQDVRVENGVQFGDLIEFCDFAFTARVCKVNVASLWSMANAPGTPKNVFILTAQLTNDTDLVWDRGSEPDLAGYEVVWRETTAPEWTNAIPVGDVTTAKIHMSKDNVFFGVRAVDKSGRRSQVAFPKPKS